MSVIDIDALVAEISPDNPCGQNMKHDNSFAELLNAAKGKPEQVMGDAIKPAEEPDWATVQKLALQLFKQTKDLRVAVNLVIALLHTKGFAGLADGLVLVNRLLEQYWDSIHPELDPDDNNDPTLRINSLSALNDSEVVCAAIRLIPIASLQGIGQFSLRDIEVVSGKVTPPTDPKYEIPNATVVEGVFRDCDINLLKSTYDSIELSLNGVKSIQQSIMGKVSAADSLDLSDLSNTLKSLEIVLKEQLTIRGAIAVSESGEAEQGGATVNASLGSGTINNRSDVIRTIEKICDYYQRNEPSSPVPLLLKRAKRMVNMNFMEIMQDMVADAVKQAEKIVGVDNS